MILIWCGICLSKRILFRIIKSIVFYLSVKFFIKQDISSFSELISAIAVICLIFSPMILMWGLKLINILLDKLNRRLNEDGYKNK